MKKKILLLMVAALLLMSLTLVSCKSNDAPSGPSDPAEQDNNTETPEVVKEKVYRFSDTFDVTTLNPHNSVDALVADIALFTDSMLYRKVPNSDGTAAIIIPDLAAKEPYLADDDGYVWRIELRQDGKWQNGEPINADTWIYSFKMLLDPDLVNSLASMLYDYYIDIENAFEYYSQKQEGNSPVAWEDVGIKKIDDYTIEIKTVQRFTAEQVMLHFMLRSNYPVYEPYYEKGMNDSRTVTTYGTSLDTYLGSGPYKFESWTQDASRIYVKNPDHWLSDYFNFDRVEVRITPDRNARVQMFENKEIDTMGLDTMTFDKYRDDPRTRRYLSLEPYHIDINSLNTNNPILQTLNFRKALFYAMNREVMAEIDGGLPSAYYINHQAGAYPEKGITYRETPEAQAIVPENYGYNPELAKEYFDAALTEIGATSATVELMCSESNEGGKAVGEYLQQELPKIFGEDKFTLTMRFVPSSTYSAIKDFRDNPNSFEIAYGGWSASLSRIYPYAAFRYFISSYNSRPNSYITERFDEQFKACQAEEVRLNPELMVKMTAELEKIYLEDVINVPLYQYYDYTLISERITVPCDDYIPGFGYGTMFGDIAE